MLQIKSFGTKEGCCQATQPEQGYQGNRDDPKLDLRNGVALVVHQHTHMGTQTHTLRLALRACCFQGPSDKHKQTEGFSWKTQSTTEMSTRGTNKVQCFQSRPVLKLSGARVRQL